MGKRLITAGIAAGAALALVAATPAAAQMRGGSGGHFAGRTGGQVATRGQFSGRGGAFVGGDRFGGRFRGGRFGGPGFFFGVGPYWGYPYYGYPGCWTWVWNPYWGRYVQAPGYC
jgi:hypothetical protein